MKRMDRYKNENASNTTRVSMNHELYQNISNNVTYANITDVANANAYVLNNNDTNHTTRESYQKMQIYQGVEDVPKVKRELDDFNHLYKRQENKIYDINSVLETARKNRQEEDKLDEKRKLKNNSYNILAGINKKELEKYREEKKKRMLTPEEEEIRELMNTIASKTLAGELSKETTVDLLSDLMATSMLDKVEASDKITADDDKEPTIIEENKDEEKEEVKEESKDEPKEDTKEVTLSGKDPDFYTRSMDLSDKDFDISQEFKEKKMPGILKFFIFLLISAIITVAAYFIYLKIK